jgi:serine/threonine-protein kinase RsbW
MAIVGGQDVTDETTASAIRSAASTNPPAVRAGGTDSARADRVGSVGGATAEADAEGASAGGASAGGASAGGASAGGASAAGASAAGASRTAGAVASVAEPPQDHGEGQDRVVVRLPADGAYLSVLRTATAGLAARLDFTLDEIEDLRIAVDEACAMLLGQAIPGSSLECCFTLGRENMTISVSVPCLTPQVPASDTFAWTVLAALAGSVDAHAGPGDRLTIVMRKSRDSSGPV